MTTPEKHGNHVEAWVGGYILALEDIARDIAKMEEVAAENSPQGYFYALKEVLAAIEDSMEQSRITMLTLKEMS